MSESPPDVPTSPPEGEEYASKALGADSRHLAYYESNCGRSGPQESSPSQHTRGESASDATRPGGAPQPRESAADRGPLAQHEDNGSDVPFSGDAQGSAYTKRQRSRRKRWTLLETHWKESSVDRCRACRRWRADRSKGYEVCVSEYDRPEGEGTEKKAYVGNIQTCRSSWGCPVCAAKIRQKRAEQIAKAAARHLDQGGGLEFVMLTMPHDRGDDLEGLLDALKDGWDGISKGYARRKDWDRYGIEHYVRSLDLTWSPRAGWHPHYHVLVLTEDPLTDQERRDIEQRWYRRWAEAIEDDGYRRPERRGVRFRGIESDAAARTIGVYTAEGVLEQHREVEDEPERMDMGWEMSRHDLKDESGYTPWDLLEHLDHYRRRIKKAEAKVDEAGGWKAAAEERWNGVPPDPDEARAQVDAWRAEAEKYRKLWREYEQATKGRRSIQPSRELWADYSVTEGDLEDEELAEENQDGEVVATLDPTTMEWCRRIRGGYAALLEAAEDGTYIKRAPDGRIEMTGERARKAGASAVGLTTYISAVREHIRVWKRGG